MVGHVDCEEAESFGGGFKGEVTYFNEVEIRVEGRAVIFPGRVVNSLS